jgi:hypothetical protein
MSFLWKCCPHVWKVRLSFCGVKSAESWWLTHTRAFLCLHINVKTNASAFKRVRTRQRKSCFGHQVLKRPLAIERCHFHSFSLSFFFLFLSFFLSLSFLSLSLSFSLFLFLSLSFCLSSFLSFFHSIKLFYASSICTFPFSVLYKRPSFHTCFPVSLFLFFLFHFTHAFSGGRERENER